MNQNKPPSLIELGHQQLSIELMNDSDFNVRNQWCIEEGWNIGPNDSEVYYKIDSLGHLMVKDCSHTALASISLIKHSPTFFTLGPFIVHKAYRHQGIGERLWNKAFERVDQEYPEATIALCSVLAQVNRYKKSGFIPIFNNQRWYIHPRAHFQRSHSIQCIPFTKELIKEVSRYHHKNDPIAREVLLTETLKSPGTKALVFMNDNTVEGYGIMRRCIRGFRLGSLTANTQEIAYSLITGLLSYSQGEPVFIDVPAQNPQGESCMKSLHAVRKHDEDTVTMLKGINISEQLKPWNNQYGLFSLEIG